MSDSRERHAGLKDRTHELAKPFVLFVFFMVSPPGAGWARLGTGGTWARRRPRGRQVLFTWALLAQKAHKLAACGYGCAPMAGTTFGMTAKRLNPLNRRA